MFKADHLKKILLASIVCYVPGNCANLWFYSCGYQCQLDPAAAGG